MTRTATGSLVQQIEVLLEGGSVTGLTDPQLLVQFTTSRDFAREAAFAALVTRHGPMVLEICRQLLGDLHHSEDAFQAVFLVLARKAGSIREPELLSNWLYGVALRTARNAKVRLDRQRKHEEGGSMRRSGSDSSFPVEPLIQPAEQPALDCDQAEALHEEVGRLPRSFRLPVVLCYIEGLTLDEAARRLRWPTGTVHSRLARARDKLRRGLTRRGVVLLAAALAAALGPRAASARILSPLCDTTTKAAIQFALDQTAGGTVPASVAVLAQEVLRTMLINKLRLSVLTVLLLCAVGTGAGLLGHSPVMRSEPRRPQVGPQHEQKPDGLSQVQVGTIRGKVVDELGKPVSDAQVVWSAHRPTGSNAEPSEAATKTDAAGQFQLALPSPNRAAFFRFWAYRPGSAIALREGNTPPFDLALRKPQPRTVKVEGPDGRPVAGARLSPQLLSLAGPSRSNEVPERLAMPLAVTTGTDGQATLNYLAGGDQLVAVRIMAASVGTQDLQVLENPRRDIQGTTITIRLKLTQRLAGRVRNRAGQPVAGQEVEIWSMSPVWRRKYPVRFQDAPLRTAADGTFRTPDNLLVGLSYQVVIRAPGFEPILSKWLTIGEQTPPLLTMLQRPLRTIHGRVVDRQGKPLANVEVFQSGDGPERTKTKTDGEGRFALGGFREAAVFLFARHEGFRFFGRLIKPGEDKIAVQLTRVGEQPAPKLRTLPEPVSQEESRALARRLIEPCWETSIARKDPGAAGRALVSLAVADPVGALQKLEAEDVTTPHLVTQIKMSAARALARSDPDRAQKVAESIVDPSFYRIRTLVALADALPRETRDRKLALLARAAVQAKAAKESVSTAILALRLNELGEKEKAKALVAGLPGSAIGDPNRRGLFGLRLARVDPPAALNLARELAASGRVNPNGILWNVALGPSVLDPSLIEHPDANGILWNVAIGLSADNPVEAERVLRLVPQEVGQNWLHPAIAWKMASSDPTRARRLVDESQRYYDSPQSYLYLAWGLKGRDPAAAEEAFWKGIQGIDRLMEEGEGSLAFQIRGGPAALLPLAEQIDPTLVPEVFWRSVAARPPIGNPRLLIDGSLSELVQFLSWYDREVAAAVFEPERARMDQLDDRELANSSNRFLSWSLLDPRAAVTKIEQLSATSDLDTRAVSELREEIGRWLGRSYEDRWPWVWASYGYGQMQAPLDCDVYIW